MYELLPRATSLRKVTFRSADRDSLRARQRIEQVVSAVDWSPPGLSPRAVLLVRRLEAKLQTEGLFREEITQRLREHANAARRPWIELDAKSAGAVWFVDEDEVAACLVRDWLQDDVQECWWWRPILSGATVSEWIRKHIVLHGERLVPVLEKLSANGDVVSWLARWRDSDVHIALCGIANAFAVPDSFNSFELETSTSQPLAHQGSAQTRARSNQTPSLASGVIRLMDVVPELRIESLPPITARLLAWGLVAARQPGWLCATECGQAIEALIESKRVNLLEQLSAPTSELHPPPVTEVPPHAVGPNELQSAPRIGKNDSKKRGKALGNARPSQGGITPPPIEMGRDTLDAPLPTRSAQDFDRIVPYANPPVQVFSPAKEIPAPSPTINFIPPPILKEIPSNEVTLHESLPPMPQAVLTDYGGIFYLINVAIALGIYGELHYLLGIGSP
jgi:hypothetical protein